MFMKYLSEYHPSRIRSTSSLKTEAGSLRRSKTLITADYRGGKAPPSLALGAPVCSTYRVSEGNGVRPPQGPGRVPLPEGTAHQRARALDLVRPGAALAGVPLERPPDPSRSRPGRRGRLP